MSFNTPSKEELISLYLNEKLTLEQIANKYDVSKASVCRWLKKHNIKAFKGRNEKKPLSKDVLISLYVDQKLTTEQIAEKTGTHRVTVAKWLKVCGIERTNITKPKEIPSREILEDLYLKKFKTLDEIAKMFNVNRNLVSKWLNSFDIKIRMFGTKIEVPTEEILIDLYENQHLTIDKIALLYNTSNSVVSRWFKKFNINIKSNQRKYYHLKAIPFTKKQKEFIIGTMLGDGHLSCVGKKKSVRLAIIHSIKQTDYFFWKKNIMKNFINNVNVYKEKTRNSIRLSSVSINHDEFKFYHKLFYDNNKKVIRKELSYYLTPFAMAVWVMDDGWKNHNVNIRISSEGFSYEENKLLCDIIKANFDINCKVNEYKKNDKNYYYISFNKRNSILLTKLIEPYVIDSMKYKLINLSLLND